ncbi:MAG: 2-C-methyl-D-erythritol 2,4-cyclodiphosphate synthase [Planctomycetota bacterium]|nr:2-C-methyl-D-erythritol 2,4-cyclodiphosphate synthase [Planctomycetota bacterium]
MIHTRVGLGFDSHQLVTGRPCMLGGVLLEHPTGPAGHSDGDAVLHAVADAVLGAAGLDDLGTLFPDTDNAWKDADSSALLRDVYQRVLSTGWQVGNLDIVIATDGPRIAPYRDAMRKQIAKCLDIQPDSVNVKGKSLEGLVALAKGNSVAVQAVVLLQRSKQV